MFRKVVGLKIYTNSIKIPVLYDFVSNSTTLTPNDRSHSDGLASARQYTIDHNPAVCHKCADAQPNALGGKVAIVSGSAQGIGFEMARELLRNGLKAITIADMDDRKGQSAAQELDNEFGKGKALFAECDVSKSVQFDYAFKKTMNSFKRIDYVINNAGVFNDSRWEDEIITNLGGCVIGSLLGMQYMSKMCHGSGGVVVNVASPCAVSPLKGCPVYTSTQAGIVALCRSLGSCPHYSRTEVKVIGLCVGPTDTDMMEGLNTKAMNDSFGQELEVELKDESLQSPRYVAEALVRVLATGASGSIWVAEKCQDAYEICLPSEISQLRIIQLSTDPYSEPTKKRKLSTTKISVDKEPKPTNSSPPHICCRKDLAKVKALELRKLKKRKAVKRKLKKIKSKQRDATKELKQTDLPLGAICNQDKLDNSSTTAEMLVQNGSEKNYVILGGSRLAGDGNDTTERKTTELTSTAGCVKQEASNAEGDFDNLCPCPKRTADPHRDSACPKSKTYYDLTGPSPVKQAKIMPETRITCTSPIPPPMAAPTQDQQGPHAQLIRLIHMLQAFVQSRLQSTPTAPTAEQLAEIVNKSTTTAHCSDEQETQESRNIDSMCNAWQSPTNHAQYCKAMQIVEDEGEEFFCEEITAAEKQPASSNEYVPNAKYTH